MELKNLFVVLLTNSAGSSSAFLDIYSLIVLLFGIIVIIIKNPIGSLIALIGVYAFISIYLISNGLTFIGLSYLIVYIGAVSILFLFILMLINIRTSELQSNNWNSIPLASSIGVFLNFTLLDLLPYSMNNFSSKLNDFINKFSQVFTSFDFWTLLQSSDSQLTGQVLYVSSSNWDSNMAETSHMSTIGNLLYTSYNIWLFLASIILLLAMVGAIIITIKK